MGPKNEFEELMTTYKVEALQVKLNDGERNRVIYVGSMPANELALVADVPSFKNDTENESIARDVLSRPSREWQRPEIDDKVKRIKERFDRIGEFMPNPVLLAVNDQGAVEAKPHTSGDNVSGIWTISITRPATKRSKKPLWILDGQHRVKGLSQTTRSDNPIPLVLLYSREGDGYSQADYARIFAEVSTLMTPLNVLHDEWLRFAFDLSPYEVSEHNDAMKATALLCREQEFTASKVIKNRYHNKVQFNPELGIRPDPAYRNGFAFDVISLKTFIYQHYYKKPSSGRRLKAEELAANLADATNALADKITNPEQAAFCGDGEKVHSYFYEAFVAGVLERLLVDPDTDWRKLLKSLKFDETNWDFPLKQDGRSGTWGTASRDVSRGVFIDALVNGAIPCGADDLVECLKGKKSELTLVASQMGPHGKKIGSPAPLTQVCKPNQKYKWDLGGRTHLKLSTSVNVHSKVYIQDEDGLSTDKTKDLARKSGHVVLDDEPYRFDIVFRHYGGFESRVGLETSPG
jgi:DGQHR domain-containing protein